MRSWITPMTLALAVAAAAISMPDAGASAAPAAKAATKSWHGAGRTPARATRRSTGRKVRWSKAHGYHTQLGIRPVRVCRLDDSHGHRRAKEGWRHQCRTVRAPVRATSRWRHHRFLYRGYGYPAFAVGINR